MGFFSFIKDAGEKLLGAGEAKAATTTAKADPTPVNLEAANLAAATAILDYITKMNLTADGLAVKFDAAKDEVTLYGDAATQEDKEKILLCCGNVAGVGTVTDEMTVKEPAETPVFYTVVKGDNLSKISKEHYGTPNQYMKIFEANKPMLGHPDKIYPGQSLRIPK